jgi:hypothetical protein
VSGCQALLKRSAFEGHKAFSITQLENITGMAATAMYMDNLPRHGQGKTTMLLSTQKLLLCSTTEQQCC